MTSNSLPENEMCISLTRTFFCSCHDNIIGGLWTHLNNKRGFPLYRGKLTAIGDFGNKVKQGTGNWKKKFIIITENL